MKFLVLFSILAVHCQWFVQFHSYYFISGFRLIIWCDISGWLCFNIVGCHLCRPLLLHLTSYLATATRVPCVMPSSWLQLTLLHWYGLLEVMIVQRHSMTSYITRTSPYGNMPARRFHLTPILYCTWRQSKTSSSWVIFFAQSTWIIASAMNTRPVMMPNAWKCKNMATNIDSSTSNLYCVDILVTIHLREVYLEYSTDVLQSRQQMRSYVPYWLAFSLGRL